MEDKIIKYFEGKMHHAERIDFLRDVDSDKELKKLFINMQNTDALMHIVSEKKDEYHGKTAYRQFKQITRRKTVRRVLLNSVAYAASIALLVVATWYFAVNSGASARMTEVYAPAGQRARLTLDDGSVVWLNARSTLTYPSVFSGNRHVALSGEAFFEVAANPDKPFTVTAQGVNITALGTRFNVSSYPENDRVQASLIEGSVKVWDDSGQELVLQPSQQAHYHNHRLLLEPIEHSDYFLWTKGVYSFVNEPLTSIIQKLERYYDVKIEVADASVLDYEFTGKFRQQDGVDMILRIIQRIHPFKIERKEDMIVLRKITK
ncbi:MAG: DUF4974 domain-containing protein [Bacteroidales bacterium]|jgi:ferric-dicitrate binding protein FerR (iron transport regulator)|nr:DUF4974 domain-containing protein [Bacteroidales bacterium]